MSSTAAIPTSWQSSGAAAIGYTTLAGAGNYVLLVDGDGRRPKLLLQRVDEPKAGKNRMHFDIETPTVDEEVARLEGLGARRIVDGAMEEHGNRWVVMADPEAMSSASATPDSRRSGCPRDGQRSAVRRSEWNPEHNRSSASIVSPASA